MAILLTTDDTRREVFLKAEQAKVQTGGGVSVLPLNVSQNGEYTAPDGFAYSPITVDVQGGGLPSGIAEMSCGTFTAAADAPNTTLTIPHGMSAAPNFFHITRKDNNSSGNGAKYILGALYDSRGSKTMAARLYSNESGDFTSTGMNYVGTYSYANALNLRVYYYGGYGIKAGDYDWVAIRFEEA